MTRAGEISITALLAEDKDLVRQSIKQIFEAGIDP